MGRAFLAIRENPVAAGGIGINVQKYKVMAFASALCLRGLPAPCTRISWALSAGDLQYLPVSHVHDHAALRRDGQFRRALIGAAVISVLNESLQVLGSYRMLVYGAFILVVLLFLPRGISGIIDIIRELLHRRKGGTMLTLHEATIRFGGLTAVDHVGFTVEKGQIFGVIG